MMEKAVGKKLLRWWVVWVFQREVFLTGGFLDGQHQRQSACPSLHPGMVQGLDREQLAANYPFSNTERTLQFCLGVGGASAVPHVHLAWLKALYHGSVEMQNRSVVIS